MVGGRAIGLVALGALVWAWTATISAQTPCPVVLFEKVVDRDSAIPGVPGPWGLESGGIAISAGRVAFLSNTENYQNRDLYLGTPSEIVLVADRATPVPGGTGHFTGLSFFPGGADGPVVAFSGGDTTVSPPVGGIYLTSGNTLDLVLDTTMITTPGGTQPLIGVSDPSLSGRNLGFTATKFTTHYSEAAYLWRDGELIELASQKTPVPGGVGTFLTFSTPRISGSRALFLGRDSNSPFFTHGLYLWDAGDLRLVADGRTPAPGGTGNFRIFLSATLLGSTAYFVNGDDVEETALYRWEDGEITRLADRNTLDLDGNPVGPPSVVVVTAQGLMLTTGLLFGGRQVFLDQGQGLCRVFADEDEIDGDSAVLEWAAFDGNYLGLRLHFASDNRAIYRGTVIPPQEIPTLNTWTAIAMAAVFALIALWLLGGRSATS